jgi:hypothetical protein
MSAIQISKSHSTLEHFNAVHRLLKASSFALEHSGLYELKDHQSEVGERLETSITWVIKIIIFDVDTRVSMRQKIQAVVTKRHPEIDLSWRLKPFDLQAYCVKGEQSVQSMNGINETL